MARPRTLQQSILGPAAGSIQISRPTSPHYHSQGSVLTAHVDKFFSGKKSCRFLTTANLCISCAIGCVFLVLAKLVPIPPVSHPTSTRLFVLYLCPGHAADPGKVSLSQNHVRSWGVESHHVCFCSMPTAKDLSGSSNWVIIHIIWCVTKEIFCSWDSLTLRCRT